MSYQDYLAYRPLFEKKNITWHKGAWQTPDGKIVPYEVADLSDLLQLDRDVDPNDVHMQMTITRWPRKVVFHVHFFEGIEDWGDKDYPIFHEMTRKKYELLVTDRATLDEFFDALVWDAYHELSAAQRRYEGRNDYAYLEGFNSYEEYKGDF